MSRERGSEMKTDFYFILHDVLRDGTKVYSLNMPSHGFIKRLCLNKDLAVIEAAKKHLEDGWHLP